MYTTLELLKKTEACIPGYTRMISFFTTSPAVKKLPIPIWMVGMVGNLEDMQWALDNSFVLDKEMFGKFRAYTLVPVFKTLYWRDTEPPGALTPKNTLIKEAMREIQEVKTSEGAEVVLEKYRPYYFDNIIFSKFIHNPIWEDPHKYITFVTKNYGSTLHYDLRKKLGAKLGVYFFPYQKKLSKMENLARLFCSGGDPYEELVKFLALVKFNSKTKNGVQLNSFVEGDKTKYAATLQVSDPKKIFYIYQLMNGASLQIHELLGVNVIGEALEENLGNESISGVEDKTADEILNALRSVDGEQIPTASEDNSNAEYYDWGNPQPEQETTTSPRRGTAEERRSFRQAARRTTSRVTTVSRRDDDDEERYEDREEDEC